MLETWLALAAAVVALFGAYALSVLALVRRHSLDDGPLERLTIELPSVGHSIALTHHPAEDQRFKEPIVLCHGLGANRFNMDFCDDGYGRDRLSLARYLSREGFDVWVLELRGRGHGVAPKSALWNADDEVREDVPAAIETVLDLTGAEQLIWIGHSWGGMLAYFFMASGHVLVDKVKAVVTLGSPSGVAHHNLPGFIVRLGRRLARRKRPLPLLRWARWALPFTHPIRWLSPLILPDMVQFDTKTLHKLFASLADDVNPGVIAQMVSWMDRGQMSTMDGTSYELGFAKIKVPLLLIAARFDLLAPRAAIEAMKSKVASKDVTYQLMSKDAGFSADYGHGGLVVGKEAPDEVFPLLRAWLATRATASPGQRVGSPSTT